MNTIVDLNISQLAQEFLLSFKRNITLSDIVVSNGNGRGYYRKSCADKLHI